MTRDPSAEFKRELDHFEREVNTGLQALFTFFAFHSAAHGKTQLLSKLNETPIFWNTVTHSLQCTYFVVLGRIFDNSSPHNVGKLMRQCQQSLDIFSNDALSARKRADSADADEWLPEYLRHTYVPTPQDFRRLRKRVGEYRRRYENEFKKIRDKVYAHKEFVEQEDIDRVFSGATVGELKRIYVFLSRLHKALWGLYHNGLKPNLRQQPYSVEKLLRESVTPWRSVSTQEMTVRDVKHLLNNVIMNE